MTISSYILIIIYKFIIYYVVGDGFRDRVNECVFSVQF